MYVHAHESWGMLTYQSTKHSEFERDINKLNAPENIDKI